jgi:hypothetical protein
LTRMSARISRSTGSGVGGVRMAQLCWAQQYADDAQKSRALSPQIKRITGLTRSSSGSILALFCPALSPAHA